MIDSGMFENNNNVFHFNGPNMGQINVSQDSSTLNATMTGFIEKAQAIMEMLP